MKREMAGRLTQEMVSPIVLAQVGENFAVALSTLHGHLSTLGSLAPRQQELLDAGLVELGRLERLGAQIQSVARVLVGEIAVQIEPVDFRGPRRKPSCTGRKRRELTAIS